MIIIVRVCGRLGLGLRIFREIERPFDAAAADCAGRSEQSEKVDEFAHGNEQVKNTILTEGETMDESAFDTLVEAELQRIELCLENCGIDLDIEPKAGAVLEVELENGARLVINRHTAAREIWVAAKSGGFHFRFREDGRWWSSREGVELYETLSRLISEQAGQTVRLCPG